MKRLLREAAFAFAAWAVPFAVSVCIFPLKRSNAPLFESTMGVVLVTSTTALGWWYLKTSRQRSARRGFLAGVAWMLANWVLDGLMFSAGPMKMSLAQYACDIGVAYLMFPVLMTALSRAFAAAPES